MDQDVQLRLPHAKFKLLLKSEKEARKLEKKQKEEKEKAEKDRKQNGKGAQVPTESKGSSKNDSNEPTHADLGGRHPGWIRPGLKARMVRTRFARIFWEHHPHLWDKASTFWNEVKNNIAKAESVQRTTPSHTAGGLLEMDGTKNCGGGTRIGRHQHTTSKAHTERNRNARSTCRNTVNGSTSAQPPASQGDMASGRATSRSWHAHHFRMAGKASICATENQKWLATLSGILPEIYTADWTAHTGTREARREVSSQEMHTEGAHTPTRDAKRPTVAGRMARQEGH